LKGYSPQFKGKSFITLKDTLEAFEKDDFAKGITLSRNGKYTIRRSGELLDSKINDNGSCEISWIFQNKKKIEKGKFEIIKIKGFNYFFNTNNYKIYNKETKKHIGTLNRGIIIKKK
tara:strand:+ start:295 stop:645 length:351 start_codon:yes stop_codon:yes gene_type:complete